MPESINFSNPDVFSALLFEKLKAINPGITDMELYEFRYALDYLVPEEGWPSVEVDSMEAVEKQIGDAGFFSSIQIKPRFDGRIIMDAKIASLTRMLFKGLVTGAYPAAWLNQRFYFDVRGFYFLVRTAYFTEAVLVHLGGRPYAAFEPKQAQFEAAQAIGYKEFKAANAEIDGLFIQSVQRLVAVKGTPILIAIAGPTAAGKTEIVERLRCVFEQAGQTVNAIELDNFLTDREYREEKGIRSEGKEAIHFDLFMRSLVDIIHKRRIAIPRYDFVFATSSHDLGGNLKPGAVPIEIEPADIIFIEGNFPFLLKEVAQLIGIKVVYLTDDPIRLKRKWKRDIDYRKKYDPFYFRNRFFKDQFLAAQICYRPQMEVCDILVDTTGAAMWAVPEIAGLLGPA